MIEKAGSHEVSIGGVTQKKAELVIMTHPADERAMQGALREIGSLPVVVGIGAFLRVED